MGYIIAGMICGGILAIVQGYSNSKKTPPKREENKKVKHTGIVRILHKHD